MPTPRRTSVLLVTSALAVSTTATVAQISTATAAHASSAQRSNKALAAPLVSARGWTRGQFGCLSLLWSRESGWNHRAHNRYSGAYGIPQALPGGKMASAGRDWRTNPRTQIKWGLSYIKKRYGSPCGAWAHFQSRGWY
ncbi:transglycosylase SLT domain-containing protein [Streptosporangium sp. NBC_01756]|uniref:aggregation-promoting factor C-terminal-like domain-containing protein n=1 Tax=Streptosporangium sp. NBC_01756 TaxID=2975950 RepID=UPI002DDA3396|nr:transglycosylase SLT domain-containing protein [Streptosporangium sp. NBC_01756]